MGKVKLLPCVDCAEAGKETWVEVSIFNSRAELVRCPECGKARQEHFASLKTPRYIEGIRLMKEEHLKDLAYRHAKYLAVRRVGNKSGYKPGEAGKL